MVPWQGLAQFRFYAFTEALPASARLWQELTEQPSAFFLQEFMILISVLDTYLVYHQCLDGVTTSPHICNRILGSWFSPLVFGNLISFLVLFAISNLFFESLNWLNTLKNTRQIRNTDIRSFYGRKALYAWYSHVWKINIGCCETYLVFLRLCLRY